MIKVRKGLRIERSLCVAMLGVTLALSCGSQPASEESLDSQPQVRQDEPIRRGETRKRSDGFSDIVLYTQHGDAVRFFEDLVKDRVVMINFVYTTCPKICPATTAQLAKISDSLGPWIGRDIVMLSISIDPDVDNPKRLKEYWELFGSKPGWIFLTGDYDEIDQLRRELGVYDLDPVIDADKTQHAGIVTFGNDRTDRWSALPVFMHRKLLAKTVLDTTWDNQWTTSARPISRNPSKSELFSGSGVVRNIAASRGEVLISHEDIPGLMMAMTMTFEVKDRSLLDDLSVGQRVEFKVEIEGSDHRIVSITTLGGAPGELHGDDLAPALGRTAS